MSVSGREDEEEGAGAWRRGLPRRDVDTFGIRTQQGHPVPIKHGFSRKGTKGAKTEVFAQRPHVIVQSNPDASYLANTWSLTHEH